MSGRPRCERRLRSSEREVVPSRPGAVRDQRAARGDPRRSWCRCCSPSAPGSTTCRSSDEDKLVQTANRQHTREVILAAPRGTIVDDRGRPLVTNRSSLVVSVNRSALQAQADGGTAVLPRLGRSLNVAPVELRQRITPCAKGVPRPCWNGSPYQPVPVVTDPTARRWC